MRLELALLAVLTAAAPAAAPVVSYDPDTEFHHYRSYTWAFAHTPSNIDPTLYRQVRHSIDQSLEAHGFVHSPHADFAVGFTVGPRARMHASDFGHYAFYYSASEAASHQDWINRELAQRSDHDDTLSIDIYDTQTKSSVWHGIAPDPVVPHTRPSIVEHEVDAVVSLFPPRK